MYIAVCISHARTFLKSTNKCFAVNFTNHAPRSFFAWHSVCGWGWCKCSNGFAGLEGLWSQGVHNSHTKLAGGQLFYCEYKPLLSRGWKNPTLFLHSKVSPLEKHIFQPIQSQQSSMLPIRLTFFNSTSSNRPSHKRRWIFSLLSFEFSWLLFVSCFCQWQKRLVEGGDRQGTAYLNLIWLCPARLTLRMDLLSQFDIYHPASNSSYPSFTWGILQQLNSIC